MLTKTEKKRLAKIRRELIKHDRDRRDNTWHDSDMNVDKEYDHMLKRLGWWEDAYPHKTHMPVDSDIRQAVILSGMCTPWQLRLKGKLQDPWNNQIISEPEKLTRFTFTGPVFKRFLTGKEAHIKDKALLAKRRQQQGLREQLVKAGSIS
jgi:hypothetical protein